MHKLRVVYYAVCFSVDEYLVNWCGVNTLDVCLEGLLFELQPVHWQLWEIFLVAFLSPFMQMVQY
jgi:hypothetical protein